MDAETVTSFDAVGNTLIVDGTGTIDSFASDATQLTPFLGPTKVHQPTMVYRLSTGEFLVGCKLGGGCTDPLRVFTAAGQLARTFPNTDHSGNALWVTDEGPWEAAEDSQGRVWVTAFINTGSTSGAVLLFDVATGSFVQKGALPPDPHQVISSRFAPLGIAALADGTMLTGLQTSGDSEYVVSYADPDHAQIVLMDYAQCIANGAAAPTCTHTSFGYGNISGLYVAGGKLIAGLTGTDNVSIVAYQNPGLGFITGSAKVNVNSDDFYNDYFSHIVPLGNDYLAGPMFGYDCIHIVDGQTLYTPADWTKSTTGCWLNGSQLNDEIRGMYHLTAP
jgi:hypothetical protein